HTEASGNIHQRLKRADHARFDDLIAVSAHVRLLMKMQPDAMGDKADGLETQLAKLIEKLAVDLRTARPRLDQIHDQIFTLDQVGPDLVLFRRCSADHSGTADTGEIATLLAENFHADDVAMF